jgi:DNA-binding transcriptional LysR family regulator
VRDQQPRNPKLRCITLAQEEHYVVVMRPGHPLSRGRLDPDRYYRAAHALVSVIGGGFQGAVDAQLAAVGRTRSVMVSVPTFLAGIELVRQSDLLLSMPRRLAQHYRGLIVSRALPVPSPSSQSRRGPKATAIHPRLSNVPGHRDVLRNDRSIAIPMPLKPKGASQPCSTAARRRGRLCRFPRYRPFGQAMAVIGKIRDTPGTRASTSRLI